MRGLTENSRLWHELEAELKKRKLPERMVFALADAGLGLQVRNPTYRKQAEISDQVAKLDLKKLVDTGLLSPKGERRGRRYVAGEPTKQITQESKLPRESYDPFAEVKALKKKR